MTVRNLIFMLTVFLYVIYIRSDQEVIRQRAKKVVVCYYRAEPRFILVEDDLHLCTHLVIESAQLYTSNYRINYTANFVNKEYVTALKKNNSHLKITMGVDIRNAIEGFRIIENEVERLKLIYTASRLVQDNGFDGLDLIIFNFPATHEDVDALVYFIQELKETLVRVGYIVTATVLGSADKLVQFANKLADLSNFLDLFQFSTSNTTPQIKQYSITPLKSNNEAGNSSVEFVIKHLLAHGVKPVKLVLVLDVTTYAYLLTDPEMKRIRLEELVVINTSPFYRYREICPRLEANADDTEWTYRWNEDFSAAYLRQGDRVIFYDNPRSTVAKVKMAMDYGLRGFSLWATHRFTDVLCALPHDAYVEFIERYNKMKEDPNLLDKLTDLNLPNADTAEDLDGKSYGVLNNTLYFRVPEVRKETSPFLRIINQAIALSMEEKKILDGLRTNNQKSKRPYCIFWPKCDAPLPLSALATNALGSRWSN